MLKVLFGNRWVRCEVIDSDVRRDKNYHNVNGTWVHNPETGKDHFVTGFWDDVE